MKFTLYLSRFQVIELGSSSFFPLTFWIFPRTALKYAGLDAQWAVLGLVLIGLLTAWVQGALNERFPTMTGADFYLLTWGKWIGKAITTFYVPVYVIFVAMCIYFFSLTLKSFFPNTPRGIVIGALCLVAIRGAWLGVESLGRVASIVHPLTLGGVIIVFCFILLRSDRFWFPHTVTSLPNTALGVYHLFPLFFGLNLVLMLSPYYEHRKRRSIWYPVISATLGGVATLVAFMAVVMNLRFLPAQQLTFSVPFVLQLVRMQGWIVERLGILIFVFATAYTVLFVSCHFWAVSTLTARICNRSDDKFKAFIWPVAIVVACIALWFHSDEQAFEFLDKYLVPLSWVLVLISPLSTLLLAWIRGLRTEAIPITKAQQRQQAANETS